MIILLSIASIVAVAAILLIGFFMIYDNRQWDIIDKFGWLFVTLVLSFVCSAPSLLIRCKNISITYVTPSAIVKTDNVTIINHVKDNMLVLSRTEYNAIWWNSTNIMVKITSGLNIYGHEVDNSYDVVIKKDIINE